MEFDRLVGKVTIVNGNPTNFSRLNQAATENPALRFCNVADEIHTIPSFGFYGEDRDNPEAMAKCLANLPDHAKAHTKTYQHFLACFQNIKSFKKWSFYTATPFAVVSSGLKLCNVTRLTEPGDYRSLRKIAVHQPIEEWPLPDHWGFCSGYSIG